MSVNDILNDESLIPIIVALLGIMLLVFIPIGIAVGKKTNDDIYGNDEYGDIVQAKNVKIIAKRTSPHPYNQAVMINMVVFELANGERIEFAIKDSNAYGVIFEGDFGTLSYQGKRFIKFERKT